MPTIATVRAVTCLWDALHKPGLAEPQRPPAAMIALAVASGWAAYCRAPGGRAQP